VSPLRREPRSPDRALEAIVEYEVIHGALPSYVCGSLLGMLERGDPVPPLPGEMNFREADWLES
jgi:hypothetical protein